MHFWPLSKHCWQLRIGVGFTGGLIGQLDTFTVWLKTLHRPLIGVMLLKPNGNSLGFGTQAYVSAVLDGNTDPTPLNSVVLLADGCGCDCMGAR